VAWKLTMGVRGNVIPDLCSLQPFISFSVASLRVSMGVSILHDAYQSAKLEGG